MPVDRRWFIGAAVFALACAVAWFDLLRFLDLQTLKAQQLEWVAWRDAEPWRASLAFFAVYVAVTALSLPGSALMSLAVGAVFGLTWGLPIVSFASAIGATLAFLVSRSLLRDAIQTRFAGQLRIVNEGMVRDGALYLFSLRLVPAIPFFLVNLAMGLTPIRTGTFYWVSQLGMLPVSLVFVNAGTQLASVESVAGVWSPGLLISFALVGLFPLMARRLLVRVASRRSSR